jgi:hypothetical protein
MQTALVDVTWHISETTFEFCSRGVTVDMQTLTGLYFY